MLIIATLLYSDDLVSMSCDRSELELMLQTFDCVCGEVGICVNAAQTELMAIGHHEQLPDGVQLSGGNARYVDAFKYLGGAFNTHSHPHVAIRVMPALTSLALPYLNCT
jgi:hypothetical protein